MLNRNTLFLYRESLEELLQELPDRTRCLSISCCLLGAASQLSAAANGRRTGGSA